MRHRSELPTRSRATSRAIALPRPRQLAIPAMVLTVLDAVLTYTWLEQGIAEEGNPLLAALIAQFGAWSAMVARALVGMVLVLGLAALARHHGSARWGLLFVTVTLAAVLGWHFGVGMLATG